jgi:glyoxylase-like metal-dependent hydrolase (beta-lactamase superfamily II)
VRVLDDGAEVELGGAKRQVFYTRGHANYHFVIVDRSASALFNSHTFGLVYPRLQRAGHIALPSTSLTDYDGAEARVSIDKGLGLSVERAFLTHFGEIWDLDVVAGQLRRWLDVSDALVQEAASLAPEAREPTLRGKPTKSGARCRGKIKQCPCMVQVNLGNPGWIRLGYASPRRA